MGRKDEDDEDDEEDEMERNLEGMIGMMYNQSYSAEMIDTIFGFPYTTCRLRR